MPVTVDISKMPESVVNVVVDIAANAIGVPGDVTVPSADTFAINTKDDVESKIKEYAEKTLKQMLGDEYDEAKLVAQVEAQATQSSEYTLVRHARTMGAKFTCITYTFTVEVTPGTMKILYDGEEVSPEGHWLQSVKVHGSVSSKRVSAEIQHRILEDASGSERGAQILMIDVSKIKGRGWFNWDGDTSRDVLNIAVDGTVALGDPSKHLEKV
jgi:hypothetical protein